MNEYSIWNELINYINSIKIGEKFYRKDIHRYVSKSLTVDTYRRTLSLCGFISIGYGDGEYIKVEDIPNDLTINLARKIAYDKTELLKYKRKRKICQIIK